MKSPANGSARNAARGPRARALAAIVSLSLLALSCAGSGDSGQRAAPAAASSTSAPATTGSSVPPPAEREITASAMRVTSAAFVEGQAIPSRYTCDGADVSPPLAWQGVPAGTRSLALICDDPDAPVGTWVHWVVYNIPPTATGLPEGVSRAEVLPDGARQGSNDFRRLGYGGPCPPPGKPHRYFFKLYALDVAPAPRGKVTKKSLEVAIAGHILAEARLVGTYRK